tara:strand:+ start:450 stop:1787 length:1338 start_codon:yes stop_codon:yes gene_type:complete
MARVGHQPPAALTLEGLVVALREQFEDFADPRTGKNTRYTMADIALAAFSVFFTQSPSFLAHQRSMQQTKGRNNAHSLFQVGQIPTDVHIRQTLDPTPPATLYPMFASVYDALDDVGALEPYRVRHDQELIALDGTQYFASSALSCPHCTRTERGNGEVTFSHHAITPVLVAPDNPRVINLEPEFITPQDGHDKQDCESAAAKRWITRHAGRWRERGATLLGDDLYCHQPMCQHALDHGLSFIFVCKRPSHRTLYEWVDEFAEIDALDSLVVERRHGKQRYTDTYRFINDVPIRDGDDALKVSWCELSTLRHGSQEPTRKAFVTHHRITAENVAEIVACGRARWKVENENNNDLKTQGYHLEHNFGHGSQHLSALLVTMNLLAHLFHTVLEISDERYRAIREALPRRTTFFDDLRALTRYLYFESWGALLAFMMRGLELEPFDTS